MRSSSLVRDGTWFPPALGEQSLSHWICREVHCFDYCSFVVSLEIGKYASFNLCFQDSLTIWCPLELHINLRISFSILVERLGIRVEIAQNLQIALGNIDNIIKSTYRCKIAFI